MSQFALPRPALLPLVLSTLLVTGYVQSSTAADIPFPAELVSFKAAENNPVFTAEGAGHWDVSIRERGWILHEDNAYYMWFTGYDGTRSGVKKLGFATSTDGLTWHESSLNPIYDKHWVEDMMVVKQGDTYYMFAEGKNDQPHLFTSDDRIHWKRQGKLDVRLTDGKPIPPGPYGTPTAWFEDGIWYLFYERGDRGVWLATSKDMQVWTNFSDDPVLSPGPNAYDEKLIAMNQIVKYQGHYYAYYHGTQAKRSPNLWSTNVAASDDLVHWQKYDGNPLQPVGMNKSSGILVPDGQQFRLYTMHNKVDVHFPNSEK